MRHVPLRVFGASGGAFRSRFQFCAHLLAHDEILRFARDGQGKLADDPHIPEDRVWGDLAAAEIADFLAGRGHSGLELHPGANLVTVSAVGYPEHLRCLNLGNRYRHSSISRGYVFSPPRINMSFKRPVMLQ
jgi:hypothetical protein